MNQNERIIELYEALRDAYFQFEYSGEESAADAAVLQNMARALRLSEGGRVEASPKGARGSEFARRWAPNRAKEEARCVIGDDPFGDGHPW